jgi:hypothetical protein
MISRAKSGSNSHNRMSVPSSLVIAMIEINIPSLRQFQCIFPTYDDVMGKVPFPNIQKKVKDVEASGAFRFLLLE